MFNQTAKFGHQIWSPIGSFQSCKGTNLIGLFPDNWSIHLLGFVFLNKCFQPKIHIGFRKQSTWRASFMIQINVVMMAMKAQGFGPFIRGICCMQVIAAVVIIAETDNKTPFTRRYLRLFFFIAKGRSYFCLHLPFHLPNKKTISGPTHNRTTAALFTAALYYIFNPPFGAPWPWAGPCPAGVHAHLIPSPAVPIVSHRCPLTF